jgi:hypothetical protein
MTETVQPPPPQTFLMGACKWAIVLWLISYTSFSLYVVLDLWVRDVHLLCQAFGVADCSKFPGNALSAFHAILGGVIGAGVLGMVSFHKYVSLRMSFNAAHGWGYLFAPLLGAVLGLVVFALIKSGLLVFSGIAAEPQNPSFSANLSYIGVGFLAGFGWYQATQGIERLVKKFFSGDDTVREEEKPPVNSPDPEENAARVLVRPAAPPIISKIV